ncbi:MAG: glycosyltransferase [Tidjanibacter sp.]|nr:glycosyltransferase [Tidjanibacter sp.]
MVKVAFIHNRFPSGGAERVTIDIAKYLSQCDGYEVYVYASRVAEELLPEQAAETFVLRQLPLQAVPAKRAQQVEKYVVADGIDILVQVGKALAGIEGIKARTGVRTIVACHGEPFWQRYAIVYRRQRGFVRRVMWHLFNKRRYADGGLAMRKAVERTRREYESSDAYTVLCQPYKAEVAAGLGISPEENHIYAIENPEYPVADVNYDKENIVLFCGRFENWSKRIDRLLRIWGKVQRQMADWRLVLVGDGEDFEKMKSMAEELSLERASFEGHKKSVAEYYRRASIVALTSETEGWGLALTEGQAQGCIGVAFGCTSGVKEVLSPSGECGFIVPAFDEEEYAQQLLRIAAMSEEERLQIRKRAVEYRAQYSPEKIAEKWRVLFDGLVGKK